MPHRYPAALRRQVIELARSGTKIAQLAATFGMSDATIYNWLKQERIDRSEIEGLSTDQALELATGEAHRHAWDVGNGPQIDPTNRSATAVAKGRRARARDAQQARTRSPAQHAPRGHRRVS